MQRPFHNWGWAVQTVVYVTQKVSLYAPGIDDLSRKGISDEQYRGEADARIRQLKEEHQLKSFAESLPVPTHIMASEISDMRLSLTGKLSLSAQSDNHEFNVGLRRRSRLRDTLWELDLGRV